MTENETIQLVIELIGAGALVGVVYGILFAFWGRGR